MPFTNSTSFATLPLEKFMSLPLLQRDLTGKHIIVTGGSAGLGAWTVRHFATQKQPPASITLTCRNTKNGERVAQDIKRDLPSFKGQIDVESLDLNSFASVKDFAKRYNAKNRSLDIFVANAGTALTSYRKTSDGHEQTLQTNVLAQSLLALLLVPSIKRASGTTRVVTVSSMMHQYAGTGPKEEWLKPGSNYIAAMDDPKNFSAGTRYSDTKLLDVIITRKFAEHLSTLGGKRVEWVSVCPGFCHSELDRELPGVLYYFAIAIRYALGRTTESGSRNFVWAALADEKDGLRPGEWVSSCRTLPVNKYLATPAGQANEEKIYKQTIEFFKQVAPAELQGVV